MPRENPIAVATSGWIDRSDRVRLKISGPDRARFLHNLTTNDVKRLPPGQGQESFVTTLQGKTLAYVTLLALDDSILLRTETALLEGLAPHLAKYGVFDDVTIDDVSDKFSEFHIFGPDAESLLEGLAITVPVEGPLRHASSDLTGQDIRAINESPTGHPGFSLIVANAEARPLKAQLKGSTIPEIDASTFDALRIEAGTPMSGRDVTLANLPQEIGRDSKTINFVKGCYLGQETVARLDALGHVNRILKGLTLEGMTSIPPDGTALTFDGKPVGAITSAAFSPNWKCPVALGYIKVAQASDGTRLKLSMEGAGEFEATVRDLPMTGR